MEDVSPACSCSAEDIEKKKQKQRNNEKVKRIKEKIPWKYIWAICKRILWKCA